MFVRSHSVWGWEKQSYIVRNDIWGYRTNWQPSDVFVEIDFKKKIMNFYWKIKKMHYSETCKHLSARETGED